MVLIEACCGGIEDALAALAGGADRIELNSALALDGLTPSPGTLTVLREKTKKPILCMLRPRSGGFCYTGDEFDIMLRDGKALLRQGADGLVCGVLSEDGLVDTERLKALRALCEDKTLVFHRAIDAVPCWQAAFDELMAVGVDRVLTSGQRRTAPEGAAVIAQMKRYAGERMQVLPGCGIRIENAAALIKSTGCDQLHLSGGKVKRRDPTANRNPEVCFGPGTMAVLDAEYLIKLRKQLCFD